MEQHLWLLFAAWMKFVEPHLMPLSHYSSYLVHIGKYYPCCSWNRPWILPLCTTSTDNFSHFEYCYSLPINLPLPKIFYSTYCHSAIQKAQWLPIVLRKKSLLPYVIGFLPVSPGLCLFCRFVVFTLTHFIQAMWLFKYTLNVSATS